MDDSILTGAMPTTQMQSKTRRVDPNGVIAKVMKEADAYDAARRRQIALESKIRRRVAPAVKVKDAAAASQARLDTLVALLVGGQTKYSEAEFDVLFTTINSFQRVAPAVKVKEADDHAAAASQIAVKVNKHDRDAYDEFKALRAEYYAIQRQLAAVKADAAASQVAVKADAAALQVRQHNISELVRRGPTEYLKLAERVQRDVFRARYEAREASKAAVKAEEVRAAAASQAAVKAEEVRAAAALQVHRDTLAALVGGGQTKYLYHDRRVEMDGATNVEIDAMYARYELSMALWERRSAYVYT